jgi:hypothetical protein
MSQDEKWTDRTMKAAPAAPAAPHHEDMLSALVASGDIARVRGHFDQVFWESRTERPGWSHLKIALLREDRPMLRLLGAWGAAPSDEDMSALRAASGAKYPAYVALLRGAGLRQQNLAWEEIAPAAGVAPEAPVLSAEAESQRLLQLVPQDWRRLLNVVHQLGAPEAVIAGGALRDTFNGAAVKDVDVFLRSRGSQRKNRKFLEKAFGDGGFTVERQAVGSDGYGAVVREEFVGPATERAEVTTREIRRERIMESWKIVASVGSGEKTEYNVIFVDDRLDKRLSEKHTAAELKDIFRGGLLETFDIALCRIACDGDSVASTLEYRDDVRHKRISLLLPNDTTLDHLKRVIAKYPDWQLNPAAQQALAPKAPPPRRTSYYGY